MEKPTPFPPSAPDNYEAPPPQYNHAGPSYQQPQYNQSGYYNQEQQYGQPPAQYSQPPVQYNQSPVQYNQPPGQYNQPPVQFNQQPGQWDHIPALEGAPPGHGFDNRSGTGSSVSGPSDAGAPAHAHANYTPADPNVVPLTRLLREPQYIDCPNCGKRAKTKVQGRSKGKQQFMNVFWWPLPNRKHWWEVTHWFCSNCNRELASQKDSKELEILV